MPELPETETIARDLHAAIVGSCITHVAVRRADVLRSATARGLPAWLTGHRMERVWRRAKSIVCSLDGDRHLVVTPRFTGALILGASTAPATTAAAAVAAATANEASVRIAADADPYTCITLTLDDARQLRYTDVRRLGTVAALDTAAFQAWSNALGPEPLDPTFTAERFSVCIRSSQRAIKAVLMDQSRLAGVGNIYANEALWRAGIRPSKRASALSRDERAALHAELTSVLREAVSARGTSFRDYRDAFGERGSFAAQLKAYGRGGQPCARCGRTLKSSHAIDGRATVWCAACQR